MKRKELLSNRLHFFLIGALPAAAVLAYILKFGVDVPYFDEWTFADILRLNYNHTLSFDALFAPHIEHRLFFPRIILLALSSLSNWNIRVEMIFNWMASCAGFYFLWLLLKRAGIKNKAGFALIACVYFNLGQWENILWGWQVSIYLMLSSFLAAVYLLSRQEDTGKTMVPAIILGTVSSFSFLNGLLVWPAGAVQLFLARKKGGSRRSLIFWLAAGVGNWSVYFYHWTRPGDTGDIFDSLYKPLFSIQFFLSTLGSFFGFRMEEMDFAGSIPVGGEINYSLIKWWRIIGMQSVYVSIVMGLLLLSAFTVLIILNYRNSTLMPVIPFVILGAFSFISCVLITIGRVYQDSLVFGLTPRYTTYTLYFIMAIIVMFIKALESDPLRQKGRLRTALISSAVAVMVVGILSFDVSGLIEGRQTKLAGTYIREMLVKMNFEDADAMHYTFADVETDLEKIRFLSEHNMGIYRR